MATYRPQIRSAQCVHGVDLREHGGELLVEKHGSAGVEPGEVGRLHFEFRHLHLAVEVRGRGYLHRRPRARRAGWDKEERDK